MTASENVIAPSAAGLIAAYVDRFTDLLRAMDDAAVARVVTTLARARDEHRTVFIAGNGGSAATASHFANDLGKAVKQSGRTPVRVMSLSDNASWLTALANDEGYERVFSGQLENFAGEGDVLVVISASGNSPNLVRAVELARSRGMRTVGFLGFDGGALLSLVDEPVLVETEQGQYGLVETAHSLICDVVTACLIADRGERSDAAS